MEEQINTQKSLVKFLNIEQRTKYFVWVLFVMSLASIAVFAALLGISKVEAEKKVAREQTNPFGELTLEARAVVVWDTVNKRELFAKNPDLALPLASLTKVMTAITATELLSKSERIKIVEEYLKPEGDSNLLVGDSWATRDLLDYTLVTSSNDGAYALASVAQSLSTPMSKQTDAAFINKMNLLAQDIGLSNSKFWNEHGLDQELDRGGAYGSARDMALLFEYTMERYPHLMEATRYKSLALQSQSAVYDAYNTNTFVDQIPGILASKTGYTDLAGGNLVIAFDAGLNRPIIISILGSTQEGRFTDVLKLVEAAMKEIHDN